MKIFSSFVAVVVLILLVLSTSVYTVKQGHEALELKLGKFIVDKNTQKSEIFAPGLHFKWPIITSVQMFDVRLQTLNVDASRVLTAEQKYVLVDYYAKWRIDDLSAFYQATNGSVSYTNQLLGQKINNALRAVFGKRSISEVVSSQRGTVMQSLQQQAAESAKDLGIQVLDVRIKAIDLPQAIEQSVFTRMSTQREQVATKLRSEGQAKAEMIRANADRDVTVMIATAKTAAQETRAAGDKKAAAIYQTAYSQNPDFYALYRSLQIYPQVFSDRDILVLAPQGQFLKYFNSLTPPAQARKLR